jgi:hypothetical protein
MSFQATNLGLNSRNDDFIHRHTYRFMVWTCIDIIFRKVCFNQQDCGSMQFNLLLVRKPKSKRCPCFSISDCARPDPIWFTGPWDCRIIWVCSQHRRRPGVQSDVLQFAARLMQRPLTNEECIVNVESTLQSNVALTNGDFNGNIDYKRVNCLLPCWITRGYPANYLTFILDFS